MSLSLSRPFGVFVLCAGTLGGGTPIAAQTVLTTSSGVVRSSLCVGGDCNTPITFGDSTILLMENNTRIKFSDTSTGSFPANDWEIEANSSSNGGQNYIGFNDCGPSSNVGGCGTDLVFAVEAGARASSLYVEDTGDVGFGTSNPATDLHTVRGDTPTLRLEQDTSSGFAQQVWDIAGNETSFFIRDVTNGSTLPFRIRPDAPSQALVIDSDGDVGIGLLSPTEALHVIRTAAEADAFALIEASGTGADAGFLLEQGGTVPTTWEFRNQESSGRLNVGIAGGNTPLKIDSAADNNLLKLGTNSNSSAVVVTGQLLVNNIAMNVPDYVFADDYALRPLADVQAFIDTNSHLPDVPSEADIKANGVDMTAMQMTLLKKVEELTLYTLEQESTIVSLKEKAAQTDGQAAMIATLQDRLEALESTR